MNLEQVVAAICDILDQGAEAVGFVTPSHYIPHVKDIIRRLHAEGKTPVTFYNTNGYDTVESLRELEGLIDVYLPDMKYLDPGLARRFSGASDYPEAAKRALKEMYRQKGSTLIVSDEGQGLNGMIIRHLVLPGQVADSLAVLRWIADELSPDMHLSLMSQYYPTSCLAGHPELSRTISEAEYETVKEELERLGFHRGWVQELTSPDSYRPDFSREKPFES
jgi:putative pyruvate formate lyase activating enzyme